MRRGGEMCLNCPDEPSRYRLTDLDLPRQSKDGALAQMGERLHGMQEVSGSIPLGSTISF